MSFAYGGSGDGASYGGENGSAYGLPLPRRVEGVGVESATGDEVDLSWDAAGSTDEYVILQAEASGADATDYSEVATTPTTSTTVSGLEDGERYYFRVRGRNDRSDGPLSAEVDATTVLPATEITDIGNGVRGELTLSLDALDDSTDGGIDIYRSTDGSLGSAVATDLDSDTGEYTDSEAILDGEEYHYTARRITDHTQTDGEQAAQTAFLPDEDAPTLLNGVEDEVTLDRESTVSNYGDVRVQQRETGEDAWDDTATGWAEQVVANDTLTLTFEGLEDGEELEYRARTETEHVTGNWTAPVAIITKFPGATNLSITATTATSVALEHNDNADNEDGTWVWRREELDPLRDTGFGEWEVIDTIDPTDGTGPVQFTDDTVRPNRDYEYYVEPFTEHTSAESGTVSTTTELAVPNEGWYVVLKAGTGERATIPYSVIDESRPRLEPETSAVGRWTIDISPNDVLREWLRAEAYIYYNGDLWMRGPFTRYHPDGGSGDVAAKMEGFGIIQHLKGGGQAFSVQSEPGYEAFQRFADEHLNEWNVDVTPPSENIVDEDFPVQDAEDDTGLEGLFASALDGDDIAATVDSGVAPLQVAWTREGEDADRDSGASIQSFSDASGGESLTLISEVGNYAEWDFENYHRIPVDELVLYVRTRNLDAGSSTPEIEASIDSDVVGPVGVTAGPFVWQDRDSDFSGWEIQDDLEPGVHTLRLEVVDAPSSDADAFTFDVVAPLDGRFSYSLPDDLVDGYLDGPEHYRPVTLEAEPFSQSFNIVEADIDADLTNTDNGQRLQASNDGGDTWLPNDGTEENTAAVTADFAAAETFGSEIRGRVTLDGYEPNGPRDATPRLGYEPQTLSAWELQITTNALRVIDDQTFTGSPYEIADSIADDSGLVFVPDYREDGLALKAFAPGDEVLDVDWTVENADPVDTSEGYYNEITVFGPEDDNGERLQATASSETEQDRVGVVEGPAEFRPDAETEAELESIARTQLAEGVSKDTVTGSLTISSQFVQPGYAYEVDEFRKLDPRDNPAYVLKSATFEWGTMSLDFEGRQSLARAIRSIETEVRTTKRAL
ncbi:fibronectin type III domain-containing protein [Halorarum salinum]|uniref:Fibronectin type III domain-containing protein n=1 Tax=Halorarum salinum TaxID=2743089 RepID=A0A7D5LC56_9EURY|nr:fibronectin type III domain-containing protein [Halobaculum salinum]QLG63074.1 fibronectin type III domain-containing protein [Halobaculum salinum]